MRISFLCTTLALVHLLEGCGIKSPTIFERCEQTVRNYAIYRDDPAKAEDYAALFTENGSFVLAGTTVQGREALKARHLASNENAVWRHDMGNIRIGGVDLGVKGNDKLNGRSRFIVRTGPRGEAPGPATREIVGEYRDFFEEVDGECKIDHRLVIVTFDTRTEN